MKIGNGDCDMIYLHTSKWIGFLFIMLCVVKMMILIVPTEDVSSSMTLTLNNKVIFKLIVPWLTNLGLGY